MRKIKLGEEPNSKGSSVITVVAQVIAVVQVQSLAPELTHAKAMSKRNPTKETKKSQHTEKKKKEKKKKKKKERCKRQINKF